MVLTYRIIMIPVIEEVRTAALIVGYSFKVSTIESETIVNISAPGVAVGVVRSPRPGVRPNGRIIAFS